MPNDNSTEPPQSPDEPGSASPSPGDDAGQPEGLSTGEAHSAPPDSPAAEETDGGDTNLDSGQAADSAREGSSLSSGKEESDDQLSSIYDSGAPLPGQEDEPDEEAGLGGRMTFLEHLDELRRRIFFSLIALVLGTGVCWFFREQIFVFLKQPGDATIADFNLVYTKVTDTFTIWLKVAVAGGIVLSLPFVLSQVWLFISPGLYRNEKRYAVPFLLSGTLLFLIGGSFAYLIILPASLGFLVNNLGSSLTPMITAVDYFSFVVLILVGMGAVFQLPVLVAFLSIFGLVTPRFLWKHFRYAVLIIFILAAIISPTADAMNLTFWAAPMIVLYLVSIVVSWVFKRRRDRAAEG